MRLTLGLPLGLVPDINLRPAKDVVLMEVSTLSSAPVAVVPLIVHRQQLRAFKDEVDQGVAVQLPQFKGFGAVVLDFEITLQLFQYVILQVRVKHFVKEVP